MVDWAGLAKRKYDILEKKAQAARMHGSAAMLSAQTGATRAERWYGPEGLMKEELARKHPYGLPAKQAETARISATGYATSAGRGATTAEKRLGLEREEFEYSKEFLRKGKGSSGIEDEVEVAKIKKGLSSGMCPEGFVWDGQQCTPLE
jgi:hypothetical protein